nr:MAG TPA: structural protein [Caudoviricetes sp.]
MGYFIQPILTDKASSETALAIQNREPLVFTRIALGSGRHRTDIGKKNNVVQVVHSLQVAQSLSTDVADTIRLTARFDNSQIDREIIVNEIGVFAKRGNHEEFMYMYTWAEQGDVIPPKTSAYVYRDYDFNTTISKNSQITIQYNATNLVYATVPELKTTERKLQTNIDNHIGDTARHVSDQERTRWNGKADATHRHKVSDIEGLEAIIGNQTTNKANQADLNAHIQNQNNPHNVTKQQVGLGNVTNVEQASKQDFNNHATNRNNPHSVTKAQVGLGNVTNVEQASKQEFNAHATNRNNPHSVTKSQVGLGNVDNIRQASYESVEALKREFQEHEDRLNAIEYMFLQNDFTAPIRTEDGTEHTLLADENGHVIVADWKYRMEVQYGSN